MLPSLVLLAIERVGCMPKSNTIQRFLQLTLILAEVTLAVPLGGAVYPRTGTIEVDKLEPTIKAKCPSDVRSLIYNKGL